MSNLHGMAPERLISPLVLKHDHRIYTSSRKNKDIYRCWTCRLYISTYVSHRWPSVRHRRRNSWYKCRITKSCTSAARQNANASTVLQGTTPCGDRHNPKTPGNVGSVCMPWFFPQTWVSPSDSSEAYSRGCAPWLRGRPCFWWWQLKGTISSGLPDSHSQPVKSPGSSGRCPVSCQ